MFSVIFDMDGTLLDTQAICIPAWDYAGAKQGIEHMGDHIYAVCGMNKAGWMGYLKDNFKTLDISRFIDDTHEYYDKYLVVHLKPGAKELLDYLKARNVKIAIASGSGQATIEHHLNEVGLNGFFDATTGGSDVENGKPAPDIFLNAARLLNVAPESCYIFEDSANGIKAGYAAGMKCIGVPDIVDFPEEITHMLTAKLKTLDEAIEIFEAL